MPGTTSEIQKSLGLVRDVFMESGGTELAFKPMRFWLLEKEKGEHFEEEKVWLKAGRRK